MLRASEGAADKLANTHGSQRMKERQAGCPQGWPREGRAQGSFQKFSEEADLALWLDYFPIIM